jgi:hypothetical protein
MPAQTMADMHRLAALRGGRCLSSEYLGSQTNLQWECGSGHIWSARPNNVRTGHWCRTCSNAAKPKKHSIEVCRSIAEARGGRCLSEHYFNPRTKMLWECQQGHQWQALFDKVKRGSWCSICYNGRGQASDSKRLSKAIGHALERGGECLSQRWLGPKHVLSWKCEKGHQWDASSAKVYAGAWCSICAKGENPKIVELLASAARVNWKVSFDASDYVSLECCAGHQFQKPLSHALRNLSCSFCCAEVKDGIRTRAVEAVVDGQGTVLCDNGSAFTIACAAGHSFTLAYTAINNGRWCVDCSRTPGALKTSSSKPNSKLHIEFVEATTSFKCIKPPKNYGASSIITWQCPSGHRFERQLQHTIAKGCPACSGMVIARGEALKIKGLCLLNDVDHLYPSKSYDWGCKCGESTRLTHAQAVEKKCCEKCDTEKTIKEDIFKICRLSGTKISNLDTIYVDGNVASALDHEMKLTCIAGHSFTKTVRNLKYGNAGASCPTCNKTKSIASTRKYDLEFFKTYASDREGVCKNTSYERTADTLHFQCKYGHEWSIMARYLISAKSWCSKCKINRGEEYARQAFEYLFEADFPTSYPTWLKHKRHLELDGYNEELGIAFEHQGQHHSGANSFNLSNKEIATVMERDETKRRQCKAANVALVEVHALDNLTDRKVILNVIEAITAAGLVVPTRPIDDFRLQALVADNRYERLRLFIEKKNGRLMEKKYLGARSPHQYICDKGHETASTPDNLFHGKWCLQCRGTKAWETRRNKGVLA